MSLESIKEEIQKSVDIEKSRLKDEWEKKKSELSESYEKQYSEAKARALKLIEKEEQERYTEELLTFKMEVRKKLLEKRQSVHEAIIDKVISELESLVGKKEYYQFLCQKIKEFSTQGDRVYLSLEDEKTYGQDILKEVGHSISLIAKNDLKGGVIIEKGNFNYNFSPESLLDEKSIDVESFLGKKLYEEI